MTTPRFEWTFLQLVSIATAVVLSPWAAAQGSAYAFEEREPATTLEEKIEARLPSIVKVHGASGLATILPYASGVVVSDQGHILTLDLVMVQRDKTRVVLADGSVHQATLLPPEPTLGVRLLKIDPTQVATPLHPVTLGEAAAQKLRNGTFVFSLGNCFRLAEFSEKVSATFGVVTATARTNLRYLTQNIDYDGELIITDAPNNPGHFGGALFTLDGTWIGLNTRVVESRETNTQISAAIPTRDLRAYIDRWVHGKQPTGGEDEDAAAAKAPVYHGIRLFDEGGRRSPPAYVERVRRKSPAAAIKLKPDDLIVRVGRYPVRSCAEFRRAIEHFAPGDSVEITFKRGTTVKKATLVLAEKSDRSRGNR